MTTSRIHRTLIDLSCLWELMAIDRPDLKDEPWPAVTAGRLVAAEDADRPIFDVMRHRSVLVHHPYESFSTSVEEFISQAADDPKVQSIKMTLYRAGGDSAIIRSLIRAAESGKQVAVLVELKARFDEATNVQWAKQLERAGVHVVYGMVGLKTHSKVVLVVRDDGDQLRRYCHVGTGNYNAKTAKIYEDLGVLTCDDAIGDDVTELFNHLTGYSRSVDYRKLLVAPRDLRRQLLDLIEHEASFGPDGHITLKCNSIADEEMVEALYAASAAGTRIDLRRARHLLLCVRGCPGLSENIRVRSVLGRYLEHSRIYRFAHGNVVDGERVDGAQRRCGPPDRVGRPDAAQPQPSGRGDGADRAPAPRRSGSIRRSSSRSPTTWSPGSCSPTTRGCASGRPMCSSRIRRSGCTAGPSSVRRPRRASARADAAGRVRATHARRIGDIGAVLARRVATRSPPFTQRAVPFTWRPYRAACRRPDRPSGHACKPPIDLTHLEYDSVNTKRRILRRGTRPHPRRRSLRQ